MGDRFGESVSPVAAIRAILHDYPFSASILRELLQNSSDAGAKKQIFVLDMGKDGRDSALMAYNDASFHEEDWKAIQTIHQSSKITDTAKIGKYGVGFRACYHVTDGPQILSGSSFAVLDPIGSRGMRIGYDDFKRTDFCKQFEFFSELFQPSSFPGTVIRLPLRSSPSELSGRVVLAQELDQMLKDYITEELNITLLFLGYLRMVEIWKVSDANKMHLATWIKKSEKVVELRSQDSSFFVSDVILSHGDEDFSWRIIRTSNEENDARSRLSDKVGSKAVDDIYKKHKLSPDVRIAYPLSSDGYTSGRLFTFLPLPSKTDFPVHVHALFALTSSRQSLRNQSETGTVTGSDNHVLIKWNCLLFDNYIPRAWCHLLKTLTEDGLCKDIFSAWPPYCSSITSGDGLYWQNVLRGTLTFAVQSDLAIWPKVSVSDKVAYVDLRSSLVVSRGQVNLDVLIALAQVGLTLVQLPQDHIDLLDDSVVKLTPRVARDQIVARGLVSNEFDNLSQTQRRVLCEYFLSDRDFNSTYGLPLFPTLNGSYVALSDRRSTTQRHVALSNEEVGVFRSSAGGAIPLDHLQPAVAALVREMGTTQANVELLSPTSVVAYLSSEPEPRSEERLSEFWSWLSKWCQQDQAMTLFKASSSLRLIPTTKGPQLVSSPVFRALGNRWFKQLGLASISSVLPSTVIYFLNKHGVIKDAYIMQDLLAAVDLAALKPLTDDDAKSVFDHISTYYKSLSGENLTKLKKLPIFPVLIPSASVQVPTNHNTSVSWRTIDGLSIKGISPMSLIPLTNDINFLDKSCFTNPSCSLLKTLRIPVLADENILLLALEQLSSQPKSLRAAFISYIQQKHRSNNDITSVLQNTRFIRSSGGTLQSPMEVIDPNSKLLSLFPVASSGQLIPMIEDDYDRKILGDLRSLEMMKVSLSSGIVQERISYISANHTSAEALGISRSLLSLMNDSSFVCSGYSIDHSLLWLPTRVSDLVSSKECVNPGRSDTDLFDEVLETLDETISTTPSFRNLLNWDKPLPLDVLTRQMDSVLKLPNSETQHRKVHELIRELAGRHLEDSDIKALQHTIAERPWVPTESGTLALPSRAVFVDVPGSRCFQKIGFSSAERQICLFLQAMGCHERPSVSAIVGELDNLRAGTACSNIRLAIQLLEALPNSITDRERDSLLVPTNEGDLMPLGDGVYYYKGVNIDDGKIIAHPDIGEGLANKIGMKHLGVDEAEGEIDLGGKPITLIRNTLTQYDPRQFFTEFIANASDAGAKLFSVLVDGHEGPKERLCSEGLAAFQNASLVVHNDGIFTSKDFNGILQTGIGGKKGKTGVIGRFGLGALSMFHFTELAMIVSADRVLFISPSKRHLSFYGRHSLFLPLQSVKKLYPGHLEPLDGLFGFDLSSDKPYQGTLFRLPLRNELHCKQEPVSTTPWSTTKVEQMLLAEFDDVAYKSLLFTGLSRIEVLKREDGPDVETLRVIESTRVPDDSPADDLYKSETVTLKSLNLQTPKWLIVTMDVNIPDDFKGELERKYDMRCLLPMRIAATLDREQLQKTKHNLFCALPLPVTTPLPVHISAPLILEQERRNVRIDSDRTSIESKYNDWLLSSKVPQLYLCLLEKLLQVQGENVLWWPGVQSGDANVPSQIIMNAFWSSEILGKSSRRVFASTYNHTSFLSPGDVVLFSKDAHQYAGYSLTISKVLSTIQPSNIIELPFSLFECATMMAQLRSLDGAFVKTLLEHTDPPSQWLKMEGVSALVWYLMAQEMSLDGLSLIVLEDGSCAKIQSENVDAETYYVVHSEEIAAYDLFPKSRLVHRKFSASKELSKLGANISYLDEAGIIQLVEELIAPAQEFRGNETHQRWIASFWGAELGISLERISHLPLIPTIKQFQFISVSRLNDPSVTLVASESSIEGFAYGILQKLGMTIVVRGQLPQDVLRELERKKQSPYRCFLEYMHENEAKGLEEIWSLSSNDREELAKWIRSKFSGTLRNSVDFACKLPVWHVKRANSIFLTALNDVTVLPVSMPSDILQHFTDCAIIDWDEQMQNVKESGCDARRITELLRISSETILHSRVQKKAYKQFLVAFLKLPKVDGYSLLVPNKKWVLTPVNTLYECDELFLAAFKAIPERLLHNDFQDITDSLGGYGLNLGHGLDLAMFIECAKAFHQGGENDDNEDSDDDENDSGRRERSAILYEKFNGLPLQYGRDAWRIRELDQLEFIPRDISRVTEYLGIDITRYMRHEILSPSKISLARYEPICWSQRGRVSPQPNPALCGTYENLGKPTGREVVKHLKALAEIGRRHGHRPVLLSDLKATYKWLNENIDEILADIRNENERLLFLNVDDPDSDSWVGRWHSASTLVRDLQDVGRLHDVKGFLRNYDNLLEAAGARTIQRVVAQPASNIDSVALLRRRFRDLRERGYEVDVTFTARDNEHQILPAHKTWLIVNCGNFLDQFVTSGFQETDPGKRAGEECNLCVKETSKKGPCKHAKINAPDYSSLCVKETIDWTYTGELSESIISHSSNNEESEEKLELALEMLKLAHFWAVTELHQRLQEFIINAPDFINPYWVKGIREHAEAVEANDLLNACEEYEELNRLIIGDVVN